MSYEFNNITNDNEVAALENDVKYYPLTHPQKGIWYTEKLYPGTSINNIAATLRIEDSFDFNLLEKSINLIIRKNDALRLRFNESQGEPLQYLTEYKYENIDYFDFSENNIEVLYDWDTKQTQVPFNLIDSKLYYFAILKISDNEFGIYSKINHLISDGWSIVQAGNWIVDNYYTLKNGLNIEADNNRSYIDFIKDEQQYLNSDRFIKDGEYWGSQFNSFEEISMVKNSSANHGLRAKRKTFVIPNKFSTLIRQYCRDNNTSIFSLFMPALCIYINRITSKEDITIGVPVLNRTNSKEKNTLGMFVSTVPLRIKLKENINFNGLSQEMTNLWFSALRHQKFPYEYILKKARENNKNIEKLYDISLSYQNAKFVKNDSHKQEGRWHFNGYQAESLYIHINDREDDGNIILDFDYNCDIFKAKEIEFMYDHITRLLWHALDNPNKKLPYIEMMSEKEKHKILNEFNDTYADYPQDKTISRLFEEQVKRTPDNIALVFEDKNMTYAELNNKSNQLARRLQELGVKPNDIVGIMVKRSFEMMISILAVLKAGGAYLPIDPEYPVNRIDYMLEDSKASFLVIKQDKNIQIRFQGSIINALDTCLSLYDNVNLYDNKKSTDLAYLIYTSGSTGKPKGVMIEHKSLVNFCYGINKVVDLVPTKTILSMTTICFDIFFLESILPLLNGMKIVLANEEEQKNPELICELIKKYNINIIQSTPSRMQSIVNNEKFDELTMMKEILIGGESFPDTLFYDLKKKTNAKVYNMYGPTEATIWATVKDLTECRKIDIGKPIMNTQIYILDKFFNLLPIGIPGEMFISGDCLSRGYLNKIDLTNERFIENPFIQGKLMYKTGDMARWYPGGDIEYIGRADNQVKIRGYRIEPGEIESKILNITNVKEAVVTERKREDNSNYLCAYIVSSEEYNENKIRKILQKNLPSYMVPLYFVQMDSIPKTPNGKIDRKSLPAPGFTDNKLPIRDISKTNKLQRDLLKVWNKILGNVNFDIHTSFFDIGGDSLLAINLIANLNKEKGIHLKVNDIFEHPTISELADYIKDLSDNQDMIMPVSDQAYYPATSSQKRLFMIDNIDGPNITYNMPALFEIKGNIDKKRILNVFNELVKRHETLRTYFKIIDGNPMQVVNNHLDFNIEYNCISESDIQDYINKFIRPFNLNNAPLFRVGLFSTNTDKNYLICDFHHIIADGQSINIIIRDFLMLYEGKKLDELIIQYKDYSVWLNSFLQKKDLLNQKRFWLNNFLGEIPNLNLPIDYARPIKKSYNGDSIKFEIDNTIMKGLKNLAQKEDCTLFMVLLASYFVILYKYTEQEDIIVGTPFIGRAKEELDNVVGMFVNTLALRSNPNGSLSFQSFLKDIKDICINAFENQDYPFDELISNLKIKRDLSRNPLFDTLFSLRNYNITDINLDGIELTPIEFENSISKFDLSFEAIELHDKIEFNVEYCTDLFKKDTIERLCRHYINLLKIVTSNSPIILADIDLLTENEKEGLILFNSNNTIYPYKTINQLFEEQVQKTPDKNAVFFNGKHTNYKELNNKANHISGILKRNGVKNGTIVGITMQRSLNFVIGIISILKAGGAYLPIDAEYPLERKRFMVEDSRINLMLTDNRNQLPYFSGSIIDIEDELKYEVKCNNLDMVNNPEDLIYAIYTSGSTGKPKAVLLKHKNIVNLVWFEYMKAKINFCCKVLHFSSVSFDVSAQEIFSTLLSGGELYVIDDKIKKDVFKLLEFINGNGINIIFMPPSYFKQLMSDEDNIERMPLSLMHIILAGEQLVITDNMKKYIKRNNVFLHNHYGPSETHVATTYTIKPDGDIPVLPPIGKPISNTSILILNNKGIVQPIGVPGELYIAGDCVGQGYLNNKDLTDLKFLKYIFGNGLMYKTGDLARWLPDGNIEFLGRLDNQVKVRGFRIELSEIENHISNYQGIKETVVCAFNDINMNKYLCAYFVSENELNRNELKSYLQEKLPQYMIPQYFMQLNEIPMTPSGKIDRKLLPEPKNEILSQKINTPPQNQTQKAIINVWKEILDIDNIGIDDNFFELGGDSLLLIKFQIKTMQYNWNLSTQDYYEYQTAKELASRIDDDQRNNKFLIGDLFEGNSVEYKDNKIGDINATENTSNYLLFGATGFLGIHLLYELLSKPNINLYCIIRGNTVEIAKQRLKSKLIFYFGIDKTENLLNNIKILKGDITINKFGLSDEEYNYIRNNIGTVINAAAIVKHYGDYREFERINVKGSCQIADFCLYNNIKLVHISTIGVLGNCTNTYDESVLNNKMSQITNVYIKSKYQAELILQEYEAKGLKVNILRIGNLTGRYSDGLFQGNIEENALYNRIKSFIQIGYIQEDYMDINIDFTPVDICSKAITKIILSKDLNMNVFHLFNDNYLLVTDLIKYLNKFGYIIQPINRESFLNIINKISVDGNKYNALIGIIQDLNDYKDLNIIRTNISSYNTNRVLQKLDFSWPNINYNYIKRLLNYMCKTNFVFYPKKEYVNV